MYGLPPHFDGSMFVDRRLEQICFSENQVTLHFDADVSVVIESALSQQRSESDVPARILDVPVGSSDLMQLLGSAVTEASGDAEGTLTLRFENGGIVLVFDTSDQYESYQIRYGPDVIIV